MKKVEYYFKRDSAFPLKKIEDGNYYFPGYYSGYVAISKKLNRQKKIKWDIIVDKISEEKTAEVFENIEIKTQMIKDGIFEKNEKSCWQFGRRCEFFDLCKFSKTEGLIKK